MASDKSSVGTQERGSLLLAQKRQVCVRQLGSLDAKDGSGKRHSRAETWKHRGPDGGGGEGGSVPLEWALLTAVTQGWLSLCN